MFMKIIRFLFLEMCGLPWRLVMTMIPVRSLRLIALPGLTQLHQGNTGLVKSQRSIWEELLDTDLQT